MSSRFPFADINTLNESPIEIEFAAKRRCITDILSTFRTKYTPPRENKLGRLKDLKGYYIDFGNRLEELGEFYFEQKGESHLDYEVAMTATNLMIERIDEKIDFYKSAEGDK